MKKLITLLMLTITSFSVSAEVNTIDGWVRAMPPGSYMSAAYISLENKSEKALTLVAVTSTAANDCSIHETVIEDGVNRMKPLDGILLAPSKPVSMRPGGIHIMLMDMNKPLIKGEIFPLELKFSDGSSKTVDLKIGKDD